MHHSLNQAHSFNIAPTVPILHGEDVHGSLKHINMRCYLLPLAQNGCCEEVAVLENCKRVSCVIMLVRGAHGFCILGAFANSTNQGLLLAGSGRSGALCSTVEFLPSLKSGISPPGAHGPPKDAHGSDSALTC